MKGKTSKFILLLPKKKIISKYKGESMGTRKFINLLAYIAVILIVIATVFGYVSQEVFKA